MTDAPWTRSIVDLAQDLRRGELSPVDLLAACFDRIDARDGAIAAFVHRNDDAREAAVTAAQKIAEGKWRGPLHGVPIAVADNFATADMPTTAGSAVPPGVPRIDANAVARLRAAGAILVGKTRMHEFAWGMETPPSRNPHDTGRVPGGSSGGSGAAVAAGMAAAALGSDTGGSIRIPASLCGTVGFKPTFGLVGRGGMVPRSWSLDHAGPLTTSVADAALLTAVLSGPDPDDPASDGRVLSFDDLKQAMDAGAAGLTVGVCRNHFFDAVATPVADAVEAAILNLAADGARVVEFTVPELVHGLGAVFAIALASSTAYHCARLADGPADRFAPDVRLLVEMGRFVSGADYLQAERYRRRLAERFAEVFAGVDVVVGPTLPLTAWRVGERTVELGEQPESVLEAAWRLTCPWTLLGVPAISLPCGSSDGLPIGLQIAGRAFDEAAVLRAAAAVERRLGPFPKPE